MDDVARVRLYIGDTDLDIENQYLTTPVIEFLLQESGNDVLVASIEALESIVNSIALTPESWEIGDASETRATVEDLERRLDDLRNKSNAKKFQSIPVLLHTDRKDWNEFKKIFGDC